MKRKRVLSGVKDVHEASGTKGRDSAVRCARTWALRALLMVTSGALLATSPPDSFEYLFEAHHEGPTVTLTSEEPSAGFIVTVKVDSLGPDGVDTTGSCAAGSAR